MHRLLERFVKFLNRKTIGDPAHPLLIRYYLLSTPWFVVNIHKLLRSDEDRYLHDHPWDFWTLLLSGQYFEHLPGGTVRCLNAGDWLYRKAEHRHRVELNEPCWTLVLRRRTRREWGFWINGPGEPDGFGKWVQHTDYSNKQ